MNPKSILLVVLGLLLSVIIECVLILIAQDPTVVMCLLFGSLLAVLLIIIKVMKR